MSQIRPGLSRAVSMANREVSEIGGDHMPEARGRPARLLLLGAGHANLLALPILRQSLPDADILLIDPAARATYSGMFPGLIAGHYTTGQLSVDLTALAARYRIRLLCGHVSGIEPARRLVHIATADGDQVVGYDLAALDIGSHSAMPEIPGFDRYAIAVKPLGGFEARFTQFLAQSGGQGPAAVIGGGIAGAEIAMALAFRIGAGVTLIESGPAIAATLGKRARQRLIDALHRRQVRIVTGDFVAGIGEDAVFLQSGRRIASRLSIGVAGARAHGWMARDLPVDGAGFVHVGPELQVQGHADLFAAGDCASMLHAPRPKAGVFAVRQGPLVAHNMLARLRGTQLGKYRPQRDYLKIISLGGKEAVAEWYGLTLHGQWLWRWKNRIDRAFMRRLQA